MKLNITQFNNRYPDNDACLEELMQRRFKGVCKCGRKLYRLRGYLRYVCSKSHQLSPLVGTIFEKSHTPLRIWFYVIYLFSQSKNGLPATFIQRIIGVTYKCAWRMLHKIRSIMAETTKLNGRVEADETFFKPKAYKNSRLLQGLSLESGKILFGVVSNQGVRVCIIPTTSTHYINKAIQNTVVKGSHIHSDGARAYMRTEKNGYRHTAHIHYKQTPFEPGVNRFDPKPGKTTQQIENFWSQLKRGIYGTYRSVKYLLSYGNEFAFRYSYRDADIFEVLLSKLIQYSKGR